MGMCQDRISHVNTTSPLQHISTAPPLHHISIAPPLHHISHTSAEPHFPAVSGAFMDSPYNGNTSLQTSSSNLNATLSRAGEPEDEGKVSSDAIWLWIAVIATIGNIVVVAVVCACAF
ncbi:hypothetical protein ACEWY4_008503 [Coilia grayii]|uniref:Uncharacterized protein n=1 Tax=Coilia grayii TaxID=363190 RepID=A0ABD1KB18_9TELE